MSQPTLPLFPGYSKDLYLHFRQSCMALQRRFEELTPLANTPHVFLHGNPHIDNFAKTFQGEAMIDFDRARVGPYTWDLVRLLGSLSFRRPEGETAGFLDVEVIEALLEGYIPSFERPDAARGLPSLLPDAEPKAHEQSTRTYLDHNKRWAKQLRANPVFPSHPTVSSLLRLFFEGRRQADEAEKYRILEAGLAVGSLGKPRVLLVIQERNDSAADPILLDLKEVYSDPDSPHFFNPFIHHGLRMIEASHLYAEGMEQMMSYLNWQGAQYWARRIPSFKGKIEGAMNRKQQRDFALVVGAQLGRGHRRSLRATSPERVIKHLRENIADISKIAEHLNQELLVSWNLKGPHKKKGQSA